MDKGSDPVHLPDAVWTWPTTRTKRDRSSEARGRARAPQSIQQKIEASEVLITDWERPILQGEGAVAKKSFHGKEDSSNSRTSGGKRLAIEEKQTKI